MTGLDGCVAIVTGAGRGLGRAHALELAAHGAAVVVNDLGGEMDGSGGDLTPAQLVVKEIEEAGGRAIANGDDVASWDGGKRMVGQALAAFGRLDVLVNNAGILRDRLLVNMSENEFDAVVRVHLKGHFVTLRHAAEHWRERSKAGEQVKSSVINVSSASGLFGNVGQANYGPSKAGIAALSRIAAQELQRYGVRVNTIAPAARTRLTLSTPGLDEVLAPPEEGFDEWDPANVSPVIAWLAMPDCPLTGETLYVQGGDVRVVRPWSLDDAVRKDGRWTPAELGKAFADIAPTPFFDFADLT